MYKRRTNYYAYNVFAQKSVTAKKHTVLADFRPGYIGMMVCFFSGSSKFLLRSWRMDYRKRRRVSDGSITASM